jgi:hypothetical protein
MRALLLVAATAAVLSLSACKKAEEATVAVASGGAVQVDGDKTTIQTEEGTATFNSAAGQPLPDDFPKDVFVPDGATVMSSANMAGSMMVVLAIPGTNADAFAQAQKAMPGNGWTQTAAMETGPQKVLVFENGTHVAQYAFFDDGSGKGQVQVNYATK